MNEKVNVALFWGATCGGCDIAVFDTGDKIFDLLEIANIVFWPIVMDAKFKDVEAMKDKSIDVILFNGAIMNVEDREMAELLRRKSKVMVALGTCACFGGIPGLKNLVTPREMFQTVKALDQVVDVDYYVPGCAPAVGLVGKAMKIMTKMANGVELPPKGKVIAGKTSVCDGCDLNTENKIVPGIKRAYAIPEDDEKCFLEQGIICLGPATRGGCGNDCIDGKMPCRGCMGPTPNVGDQGAKMISALASLIGVGTDGEQPDSEAIQAMINQVLDPVGTFYRYTLPKSFIKKRYDEGR
jgi:F420-non-reducing hydrogenase small subunit